MTEDMQRLLRYLADHFAATGTGRLDTPFEVPGLDFDTQVVTALKRLAAADPPYVIGVEPAEADYPAVITGLTERGWETAELAHVPTASGPSPTGTSTLSAEQMRLLVAADELERAQQPPHSGGGTPTSRSGAPATPWDGLEDSVRRALSAGWRNGVPAEAAALYCRWWQLETWLRSLVYVELRARDGREWAARLPGTTGRWERDRSQSYMATPDVQARLAYLDVTPLFELLRANWALFSDALLEDEAVWAGRVVELTKIRHRIGHCRRPHGDDLGRLEQILRDLEGGAFRAAASFNREVTPKSDLADPLVDAWIRRNHEAARRLVVHADRDDQVRFDLRFSRRPWSQVAAPDEAVTGRPGYLWHASWYLAAGSLDLRRFWEDTVLDRHRDLIVFVAANHPGSIEVSFAAVDDATAVADAIGDCFTSVLRNDRLGYSQAESDTFTERYGDIDFRVQISTMWSLVDDTTVPLSIFGA